MTESPAGPLVANGWTRFAHPLFLDQVAELVEKAALEAANPVGYRRKNVTRRPCCKLLGEERRHWFRARFLQNCRLLYHPRVGTAR